MKQYILTRQPDERGYVRLAGAEFRYLARVRRLKAGDGFCAQLPGGALFHAEVRAVDDQSVLIQCVRPLTGGPLAGGPPDSQLPPLYLLQAVPKGTKLDLIVRQATETGAAGVLLFYAERSLGGLSHTAAAGLAGQDGGARLERLRRIVRQARQQSGSPVDTRVEAPRPFEEVLLRWQELAAAPPAGGGAAVDTGGAGRVAAIFLHELPLQEKNLHTVFSHKPALAGIAIGPEGGFTESEARRFIQAGFSPIIVGSSILRTETAALYALSAVRTVLLERDSWNLAKE